MKCPFCGNELKKGILYGDGRSKVHWNEGDNKLPMLEELAGKGTLSAAKYSLTIFTIDSYYCDGCKRMIIETKIEK
ncbi:PF20097 family protein [Butyrivibrio sp. MC2013]|uniref:PF20097 family protein n=1 Tax=Butyrivibrio sp. MC2013 TaxID=1280686 RepID=UPI0003FF375C|nr:PF20097 family protein [Butyrivibrio sp. MC2013]